MILKNPNVRGHLPPSMLVLMAIASTQIGAVLAKQLFTTVGYTGAISISFILAAVLLLLWHKPKLQHYTWSDRILVIAMGFALAGMYLCLYGAIDRIPLGIAISIQFVGPLGLSAAKSCHRFNLVWIFLAASGITFLSPFGQSSVHPIGVGLALLSGLLLATYITLAAKIGQRFRAGEGLALAITVSAITLLPVGITTSHKLLMYPELFLTGLGVAIFSAVVPFSLDAIALKRIPTEAFGILLSLEPAIASLLGWMILGEQLSLYSSTGVVLIMLAAAGHFRFQGDY